MLNSHAAICLSHPLQQGNELHDKVATSPVPITHIILVRTPDIRLCIVSRKAMPMHPFCARHSFGATQPNMGQMYARFQGRMTVLVIRHKKGAGMQACKMGAQAVQESHNIRTARIPGGPDSQAGMYRRSVP